MTLLPSFAETSFEPTADVAVWRATVSWAGETTIAEGDDFLATPEFRHRAAWDWDDGPTSDYDGSGRMRLDAACAAAAWFVDRARRVPEFRPEVALDCFVGDPAVNPRTVMRGRVAEWLLDGPAIELVLEAAWPWDAERPLCRDLAFLPTGIAAGLLETAWIPQVFGEVIGVPMARMDAGRSVGLRTALVRTATEATLETMPVGWPASGTAQISDETFVYSAIVDGPPRLTGLVRLAARDHGAGSRAMWLPAGGPRWLAADHGATVASIALAVDPSNAIPGGVVSSVAIDGRTATQVQLPSWPWRRLEGATVTVDAEPSTATHWQIDPITSALFPTKMFGEPDASDGAVFRIGAVTWKATAHRPADAGVERFASIERARLRFDVSFASTWTSFETLTVRARRGASVVEKILVKPAGVGVLLETSLSVDAGALGTANVAPPPELLRFDYATPTGDSIWLDADNAIQGGLETYARLDRMDGAPAPLLLARNIVPVDDTRRVARLVVLVNGRINSATPQVVATLTTPAFSVSNSAPMPDEFAWVALSLEMPPGDHPLSSLLNGDSTLAIDADGESSIFVADVVLQVEYHPQVVAIPPGGAILPFAAAQATPFATYELDVAALLADDRDWAAFDGAITVEFALSTLSSGQRAEVRHLHWVFDQRPASVRLETDLVATVRGRLAAVDGACDPVAVVGEMWRAPDLMALPPETLDAVAEARAGAVVALAGRRFRAAFWRRVALDKAMRSALGEAGLVLSPTSDGWALRAMDQIVAEPLAGRLVPGHVIDIASPRRAQPAPLEVRRLVGVRRDGSVVGDVARLSGLGDAVVEVEWLSAGWASLCWLAFDHAGHRRERLRWRARPAWWWTPLGSRLALSLPDQQLDNCDAVVQAVWFETGQTWIEALRGPAWSTQFVDLSLQVRREFPGPRLSFWVGDQKWAEFDPAGDLRLRGSVVVDPSIGPFPDGLGQEASGLLRVIFGTAGAGAMALTAEGDLRVSGGLATGATLVGPVPTIGWVSTPTGLALGTPELGLVAFLDAATGVLSLRGGVRGLV